jgi:hypothetical protein
MAGKKKKTNKQWGQVVVLRKEISWLMGLRRMHQWV